MDALRLIDKLDSHKPQRFLAPLLDADRIRVHVLLDGIPYRFDVKGAEPGWWMLKPTTKSEARIISPVESMLDVMNYLRGLPRFLVIALFRIRESTWLVVPFNDADAAQRSWPNGEPRQLHLVRHCVEPFDVLEARWLGGNLIYGMRACIADTSVTARLFRDHITDKLPPKPKFSTSEFLSAWTILREHIEEQRRQAGLQAEAKRKSSVEELLRFHLKFMGAELSSWHESGEGYRVNWTHQGQQYSMDVARSGFIESAGVCLDSQDRRHNLSSIVSVMELHRRLGRSY